MTGSESVLLSEGWGVAGCVSRNVGVDDVVSSGGGLGELLTVSWNGLFRYGDGFTSCRLGGSIVSRTLLMEGNFTGRLLDVDRHNKGDGGVVVDDGVEFRGSK